MAIQFARCEYISRSTGGNACRKASYNQREAVRCERTGELFFFKERGGNAHHEVLLPEGADRRFKDSAILWNEAENCEKRKDSQVVKEFVLALPDDAQVTLEDRIELTKRFGQIFVDKGVAVQLDVHSPHDGEKNWHAHLLVTTRRFSEDGLTFFSKKATDLDPVIRGGKVVEANIWGEVWRDLQNDYFQEKGYDIRVDPIGIMPQEHLGPVRMRHHLNEAVLRAEMLQKANEKIAQNPQAVLEEMTRNHSVFTQKDVELFLRKHVPARDREGLLERVLENPNALELYNKETKEKSSYFTTKEVRSEEEKLLRFTDAIAGRSARVLPSTAAIKGVKKRTLTDEQRKVYDFCVSTGQNFNIIQGRAGVGKSYVLNAIREAHEASGFRVLGLAPTNKVATDLKNDGFQEAKTCHSFLFAYKNNREKLDSNTLVIVDEAGMLGTTLSVELFNVVKNSGAKLILVGDDRQLSSVERGRTFRFLSERYGAVELSNVRRQSVDWQKNVSESLAEGDVKSAVQFLEDHKAISWNATKEESLSELLKSWGRDNLLNPQKSRQIITQKNVDVDALNQGARDILRTQGQLGETEIICATQRGRIAFAEGDRVQFTQTDKEQGLIKGSFGLLELINPKTKMLTVRLDNSEVKSVNPDTYDGLRHGYAATVYKAQGSTLDHVYVLHSNTTTQSTNYVALTRQKNSLRLYVSHEETPSLESLIRQMSRQDGNGTSLIFDTRKDLDKDQEEKSFATQVKHSVEDVFTKIKDVFHRNRNFYRFEKPANINQEKAEIVDHKLSVKVSGESLLRQNGIVSDVPLKVQDSSALKERAPAVKEKHLDAKVIEDALKQNMSSFADDIFSSIGEPYNAAMSSQTERRYGKKGHIAVNLKTGAWIDYKDDSLSGGPLHMLTKLKGLSFKEALEYSANWAGLSQRELSQGGLSRATIFSKELQNTTNSTKHTDVIDPEKQAKIEKAQALWNKGQPIQGTLAEQYLREHRKIEGDLPADLLYLPFFTDSISRKSFPCLMAGARSSSGEITAVQLTFLNPATAAKADLDVAKKSFGVIKGSAVMIQANENSKTLFIAEGVETALSLKSAGIEGTIKASLGLSNIKKIVPDKPEIPIVVCADHDAHDSPAAKSLEKSVTTLKEKDYFVTVVMPEQLGNDFNDVLKQQGSQGIRDTFEKRLFGKELLDKKFALSPLVEQRSLQTSQSIDGITAFESLVQQCTQKLYSYLGEERLDLTSDLRKRIEAQSERAAVFIFYAHILKGTKPREKEMTNFLLRAKYELNRILEIRDNLIHQWQRAGKYDAVKDELIAHMIAERQASIEGRMYLEAKEKGLKPSPAIPEMVARELKINRALTPILAQELASKHGASENAATYCAKDIMRFQETHGEKPSEAQIATIVQISRELDKQGYSHCIGVHNIEYIRRKEGELMFREMSAHGKDLSGFKEFPYKEESYRYAPEKTKAIGLEKPMPLKDEASKGYEMDFSM